MTDEERTEWVGVLLRVEAQHRRLMAVANEGYPSMRKAAHTQAKLWSDIVARLAQAIDATPSTEPDKRSGDK